jgi:DNA-binding CsgD family transcriptional regulator
MKSHQLAFACVGPRTMRQHDLADSAARPYGTRPSGSDPQTRSASPVHPADPATHPPGIAAILDLPVPSEARLKALFDLTAAEARLAQRLARGDSVEETALALNIKMTTARTQLAAVFAKTDTRRQAKLVAILSRVAHLG